MRQLPRFSRACRDPGYGFATSKESIPARAGGRDKPGAVQEYAKLTPGIVAKFGGKYLARAGRTVTLEGPPARSRVVVLEFPSVERAEAFYKSPEYIAARKVRAGAAQAQFVVVEGIE